MKDIEKDIRHDDRTTGEGAGVSRRGFIGGMAALGAGLIGSGMLAGCSSASTTAVSGSTSTGAATASAGTTGGSWTGSSAYAQLNPQRDDYTTNSIEDFSRSTLATPLAIGSVTMKNRILKSSATSLLANVPEAVVAYYGNVANSGVGGVFVEGSYAMFDNLDTPAHVVESPLGPRLTIAQSPLAAIAAEIHRHDIPAFVQIKTATPGVVYLWGNMPADGTKGMASELTLDDIRMLIQDTVTAAKNLKAAGFDGVEINAVGDNVPAAFLSVAQNDRDASDPYGPASIENRTRMLTEMLAGIKQECGADFPVQLLVNGAEDNDAKIGQNSALNTVEEIAELCAKLEKDGADSFELRLGVFGYHEAQFLNDGYFAGYGINGTTSYGSFFDFTTHFGGHLDGSTSGCGLMLGAAEYVKKHVSVPVGAVVYMDPAQAPDLFENALKDGKVDFLFMNRPVANADNEYVTKLLDNRIDEIRPCTRCMHCVADFGNHLDMIGGCRVNATVLRAGTPAMPEGYAVPAGDGQKNVMVIGGGPAGMEAARVCAERGYTVKLYEKSTLGNMLDFAESVKGKHENLGRLKNYLSHMLDVEHVEVVTGTTVDADLVRQEKPDVVIVATGGSYADFPLKGTDRTPVIPIVAFQSKEPGEHVVVAGFNARAIDTAFYLLAHGKKVTMVSDEPEEQLGKGQSAKLRSFTLPAYYAVGGRVLPMSTIDEIGDGEVKVTNATGTQLTLACDAVIDCTDMVPDTALADELSADFEVHAVGDCADPWDIQTAIATANLAARAC